MIRFVAVTHTLARPFSPFQSQIPHPLRINIVPLRPEFPLPSTSTAIGPVLRKSMGDDIRNKKPNHKKPLAYAMEAQKKKGVVHRSIKKNKSYLEGWKKVGKKEGEAHSKRWIEKTKVTQNISQEFV